MSFAPGFGAVIDTVKMNQWIEGLEQESDRSVVLLACAFLDELAERRLGLLFKHNEKRSKKVLRGGLSRAGARIDALASLGELQAGLADDLEGVYQLRNTLAHSWLPTRWTFAAAQTTLDRFHHVVRDANALPVKLDLRSQFILLFVRLASALAVCRLDAKIVAAADS